MQMRPPKLLDMLAFLFVHAETKGIICENSVHAAAQVPKSPDRHAVFPSFLLSILCLLFLQFSGLC